MPCSLEFNPLKNDYYPGPYSDEEFQCAYHVGIHYFDNSSRRTAIDAAYYLQQFYGGALSKTKLRRQIDRETGVLREYWEWQDDFRPLYPVSIYSHYCSRVFDPATLMPGEFAIAFSASNFFMDEIFIITPKTPTPLFDYLVAACRYRKLPVYLLVKDQNSFHKQEILSCNDEYMSLIDKALTEEFENGEKISRIYLARDKNADGICLNGDLYIDGSEEYLLPNAPLPLLKRLDEWHRLSNNERLNNIDKEQEYKWLVNSLNSFLKGKYEVRANRHYPPY